MLRQYGFPAVSVIGHMIEPKPTAPPFAQRAGLLFVGAIHTQDSPNLDGLAWFVDDGAAADRGGTGMGNQADHRRIYRTRHRPGRFEQHPRITLYGPVADLTPLYAANRIFVAPTRYAAGAPYKVLEAASRDLPVVATDVLCRQLGWAEDQDILVAGRMILPVSQQVF